MRLRQPEDVAARWREEKTEHRRDQCRARVSYRLAEKATRVIVSRDGGVAFRAGGQVRGMSNGVSGGRSDSGCGSGGAVHMRLSNVVLKTGGEQQQREQHALA